MVSLPVVQPGPLARAARAISTLKGLIREGRPLAVSWSGGKDSSAALNLVIVAAAESKAEGIAVPPIIVTHGDTGIENPEIVIYARSELKKVEAFAAVHGLDVRTHIAKPSLSQSWAFRTIGQGKLPTFPGDFRECSVEFKIKPQARLLKQVMRELAESTGGVAPVVIIGTRFSESAGREARMQERGERADGVWQGSFGFDYLSPIADWTISDVWEYLGLAADLAILLGDPHQWHSLRPLYGTDQQWCAYSNFQETVRIYAAATGNACGVVGDKMEESVKRAEACGARFGCTICTAVGRDRSLETMIASDERYSYMAGLNRLQRWLLATRWDWSRRSWLGRTVNEHGYQRIQPDTYSPEMVEEIFLYCLTLDVEEVEAAERLGIEPRFQILSPEMIVAIDAEWSRYGLHRPFHALKLFLDVMRGARYPVPEMEEVPRTRRPAARYVYVGRDWDEGNLWQFTGLRSIWEMFEGCPAFRTTTLKNGLTVLDVHTSDQFEVDPEGAWLVLCLEAERLVREYHDDPLEGPTKAYQTYLALGTISLNPRQRQLTDTILRRTSYRARHGLAGPGVDIDALLGRSISEAEMKRRVLGSAAHVEASEQEPRASVAVQLDAFGDLVPDAA